MQGCTMQLSSVLAHFFPSLRSSAPSSTTAPVAASAPSDFHVLLDQQSKLDQGLDYTSTFEVSSNSALSHYADESGTQTEVLLSMNDQHAEHAAALQHDLSKLTSDEQQQLLHLLNSFKESDPQLLQSMLSGQGQNAELSSDEVSLSPTSTQTDLLSLYNALPHSATADSSNASMEVASMAYPQKIDAIQQLLTQLRVSQQPHLSVASLSVDSASTRSSIELPIDKVNGAFQMSSSLDVTTNSTFGNSDSQSTVAPSAQSLTTIRAALSSALEQAGVSAGIELIPTEGADAQAEMKLRFDSALNADQMATLLQQLSAMLHTPMQLVPSPSEGQSVAAGESGASASLTSSQTSGMTVRFDSQALQNVAMQSLTTQNANSATQEHGSALDANVNSKSQASIAHTTTLAGQSRQVSDNSRASAAPSLHLDAASQPSATASLSPAEDLLLQKAAENVSDRSDAHVAQEKNANTQTLSNASSNVQANVAAATTGAQSEASSLDELGQPNQVQSLKDQSNTTKHSTTAAADTLLRAPESGSRMKDTSNNTASVYTMKKLVEEMKSLGVEIENISMEISIDSRPSAKLQNIETSSSLTETNTVTPSSLAATSEPTDDASIFASNMSYLFSAAEMHNEEISSSRSETTSSNSTKTSAQRSELGNQIGEAQQDAAAVNVKNGKSERLQRSQSLFASSENVNTSLFASTDASIEEQVSLFRSADELQKEAKALDQLQSGLFTKSEDAEHVRAAFIGEQQNGGKQLGTSDEVISSRLVHAHQHGEQSLADTITEQSSTPASTSVISSNAQASLSKAADNSATTLNTALGSEHIVASTTTKLKSQGEEQELAVRNRHEQDVRSSVKATPDISNDIVGEPAAKSKTADALVSSSEQKDQHPEADSSIEKDASDATASVGQKNQAETLNVQNAGTPSNEDLHSAAALHDVKQQVDADLQALKHLEVKAQTVQRERAHGSAAIKNEANTNNASASAVSAQTLASSVERNGETATSLADALLGAEQDHVQQTELVNARTRQNVQTGLAAQRANLKNSSTHEQREHVDASGVESSATSPVPESADARTQRSESASLNGESRQEFGQQNSPQDASSSLFPSQEATVGQSAATQESNYASAQVAAQLHQASADSVVPSPAAMSPQQQRAFGMLPTEARTASKMQDQAAEHLPRVYRVPIQNFAPNASAIVKNLDMQKGGSAKLILSPEALGTVVVNLNLQESLHSINIEVASQSAKTAIEAQMPQLREQFVAQGVRIDTIAVQVRDNEKSQSFNSSTQQHSSQQKQEDREARASYLRSFEQRTDADGRGRSDSRSQRRSRDQQRRQQSRSFEQYA